MSLRKERSVKCERVVLTCIEERKGFVKVENLRHYAKVELSSFPTLQADLPKVTAINIKRK
jgi:hypothetical protein